MINRYWTCDCLWYKFSLVIRFWKNNLLPSNLGYHGTKLQPKLLGWKINRIWIDFENCINYVFQQFFSIEIESHNIRKDNLSLSGENTGTLKTDSDMALVANRCDNSFARLLEFVAVKFSISLNLSHKLNWKVIWNYSIPMLWYMIVVKNCWSYLVNI